MGFFDDEHEAAQARRRHLLKITQRLNITSEFTLSETVSTQLTQSRRNGSSNSSSSSSSSSSSNCTRICEHGRRRRLCVSCQGKGICEHKRRRRLCRVCSPASFCCHARLKERCKQCPGGGGSLCAHLRQKGSCALCGVRRYACAHNKQRSRCAECAGSGLCEHKRRRSRCRTCNRAYIHWRRKGAVVTAQSRSGLSIEPGESAGFLHMSSCVRVPTLARGRVWVSRDLMCAGASQ